MKKSIYIIFLISIMSCVVNTSKHCGLLKIEQEYYFEPNILKTGIRLGEDAIKINFSKLLFQKKILIIEGYITHGQTNIRVPYPNVYKGKKINSEEIVLSKIVEGEIDGSFVFESKFNKSDFLVINCVGYIPIVYQLK